MTLENEIKVKTAARISLSVVCCNNIKHAVFMVSKQGNIKVTEQKYGFTFLYHKWVTITGSQTTNQQKSVSLSLSLPPSLSFSLSLSLCD